MARQRPAKKTAAAKTAPHGRPSSLLDTRIIYCGDCLEQLRRLPDGCVDLITLWHRFPTGGSNSNRKYEVFRGVKTEPRPPKVRRGGSASGPPHPLQDRHAGTQAYIDYMRPRCVELARVFKKTGSFYYHCDWHASRQCC